jgi:L-threonylcarbamoyladenylate synthase
MVEIVKPVVLPFQTGDLEAVYEETEKVVRRGGIVAVPTESSYGLGASPFDDNAVSRLCRLKGRPENKPILVLIGRTDQLPSLVTGIPPAASLLMKRFWPGPLTIVMPAAPKLGLALTAGTGTIGVRCPRHPALAALLRRIGPLTGTSANRSGQSPARTAQEVQAAFGDHIDLILDGGPTAGGPPSTVVEAIEHVRIVRDGAVDGREIKQALSDAGLVLRS